MTEPRVWSVTQVNRAVRAMLEDTVESLWVSGEVANWTRARSGHCYFSLKDEQAQLRCVMFKAAAASLPADPEEGTTVRALGGLTLYEARGEYQLVVRRLEAEGAEGLWRQAFERLRAKLEVEGLLAPERKRALPRFPEAVGVVTSLVGAALADILTVIRRRAPWTRVIVRGARVQGEGAGEEVAEAIQALGGSGLVEVLIVARGGGSLEDLWAFNEEVVARAIVACPVPVISAVGHEVDVTISDLVADVRAPTPSAGAETAVKDGEGLGEALEISRTRMSGALRAIASRRREVLGLHRSQLRQSGVGLVRPRRELVDRVGDRMEAAMRGLATLKRARLSEVAGKMDVLSPLATLRRGYALPQDAEGRILRTVGAFAEGDHFALRVSDGTVPCEVQGGS
ncbi:MAG: exodeoxyribonuclease VII large subunit [Gemmatimonadetes bacterium]|jgi:exodeoxyribonuclease VII large subunit|nr:exodeoxyribonuclease VII large subunit [Gemmatimonadota bacterium]